MYSERELLMVKYSIAIQFKGTDYNMETLIGFLNLDLKALKERFPIHFEIMEINKKLKDLVKFFSKQTTMKCDMCHNVLVCKDHSEPIKFPRDKLEEFKREGSIYCEFCYRLIGRLIQNLKDDIAKMPGSMNYVDGELKITHEMKSFDEHMKNTCDQTIKENANLRRGVCLDHSARPTKLKVER